LFVDSIGTGSATSNVISHMIDMGTELRKEIIAEGVETQEQAQYLKERGVRLGQGFLFGRPMPLEELIALLEREAEPEQPNILSTVSER
jgi:sensor c-di-GMP phosphodiesterase-like protein